LIHVKAAQRPGRHHAAGAADCTIAGGRATPVDNARLSSHPPSLVAPLRLPPVPLPPPEAVLHADAQLIVCDKPAGLLAVPGRGDAGHHHLLGWLRERWPDADVVHRLDMATSGLMVFARGPEAQRRLSAQFAQRAVDKTYVALVAGELPGDAGEIELPLAPDWPRRPMQHVDPERGKPSLTRWRVLACEPGRSRVALTPVTGRSHQLRVHLLAIGHPILGDTLYAPPAVAAAAPRLLLDACALALRHPATGAALRFERPPPF
jgi:tRNA pseudouridine32 synthase/23S rRNA pseudouridine746 synthase